MNTFLSNIRKSLLGQILVLGMMFPGLGIFPMLSYANPTGGVVVSGNVNFSGGAGQLNINQGSNLAIINWQNFNIGAGELTQFNQPGVSSVALNRVMGGNMTEIAGALRANGGVFVINPNGIVVSSTGIVDVGGMAVLSTLDITNDDFLDGGAYRFRGNSGAGIVNYGTITSRGGDVVMLGNFLRNAGSVNAPGGTVAFGAGGDIIVDQAGGAKISVLAAGPGGETGIDNTGDVNAAAAELKAHGNVYALAIKNDGLIRANGYNFSGGKLTLNATGGGSVVNTGNLVARNADGTGGQISVSGSSVDLASGKVDASAISGAGGSIDVSGDSVIVGAQAEVTADGMQGGSVTIGNGESLEVAGAVSARGISGAGGSVDMTADDVVLAASSSTNVSGLSGGGDIRVGGGFQGKATDIENAETLIVEEGAELTADSLIGNAGTVILWSDDTTVFRGSVSAESFDGNGGFVEVSGLQNLGFYGSVSATSVNGNNGMLLLDPGAITVRANGLVNTPGAPGATEFIDNIFLSQTLENGTDVVLFTDGLGTGVITVEDDLRWVGTATLSLLAHTNIFLQADIQNYGTGDFNAVAGWDETVAPIPAGYGGSPLLGVNGAREETPGTNLMAAFMDDLETVNSAGYGNNGGGIFVGTGSLRGTAVGSAYGETNLFGDFIVATDGGTSNDPTQIGLRDASLNPTGDINLIAKDEIRLSASDSNSNGVNNSHVLVGHGGANDEWQTAAYRPGNGDLSGDIRVIAGGALKMYGSNDRSFAQIGHGGIYVVGDKDGDITVIADSIEMVGGKVATIDGTNRAGVRIGHGGYESPGSTDLGTDPNGKGFSGDIYVYSATRITGQVSNEVNNGNGANYWQIGHGGYRSGVIGAYETANPQRVTATGIIRETTGTGNPTDQQASYSMEGHSGAIYVEAATGDIHVTAGSRNNHEVRIGHGGREVNGNHNLDLLSTPTAETDGLKAGITVIAGRDIIFDRFQHPSVLRASDDAPVQIGLGGDRAYGRFSGDIDIHAGRDIEMHAGHSRSYAQIGHGGSGDAGTWNSSTLNNRNGHATLSGNINIEAGGNLKMFGGAEETQAYAQVGHGGYFRIADGLKPDNVTIVDPTEAGHHGDITIDVGGDVIVSSKPDADGDLSDVGGSENYAQIGHGGIRSMGDHYGLIDIMAGGDVTVEAGFGGYEEYRGGTNDDYDSSQTGYDNYAMIGHGGFQAFQPNDRDTNSTYTWNGNTNGMGIGAAGASDISITAGGNLSLIATDVLGSMRDNQTSQFDDDSFDFTVTIIDVQDSAGDVLIYTDGPHGLVDGDRVALTNLDGSLNAIQYEIEVIDVDQFILVGVDAGSVVLTDVDGEASKHTVRPVISRSGRNFAQVGHGGYGDNDNERKLDVDSVFSGDITIDVGGYALVQAGQIIQKENTNPGLGGVNRIEYSYAMIGHGGQFIRASYDGEIFVKAGSDISLQGGEGFREFAKIGHGGYESAVDNSVNTTEMLGDITVLSTGGGISLTGGGLTNPLAPTSWSDFSYAQIGHGANNRTQTITQDITVSAFNNLTLQGGPGLRDAYAQIGHGGLHNADGDFTGIIDITAGDSIFVTSTSGQDIDDGAGGTTPSLRNYAKIGHGDTDSQGRTKSTGTWNGDIYVRAGDNFTSVAGMIGHSDPENLGGADSPIRTTAGNTYLAVGRDNPFVAATFTTDDATRITSAFYGSGSELRIYMPYPSGNNIAEGTLLNNRDYTRTPAPSGTRADEVIATGHVLEVGTEGELTGTFIPDGAFLDNAFGRYTIYYAGLTSPTSVTPQTVVIPTTIGLFPFLQFSYPDLFDLFNRSEDQFEYDGYEDGIAFGNTPGEASEGEENQPSSSIFEEVLDGTFGSRRNYSDDEEENEDAQRRRVRAERKGGISSLVFYIFDPNTNKYSSYRVFGDPRGNVSAAQ